MFVFLYNARVSSRRYQNQHGTIKGTFDSYYQVAWDNGNSSVVPAWELIPEGN